MCLAAFSLFLVVFLLNDPATSAIYTLSLHDALPISRPPLPEHSLECLVGEVDPLPRSPARDEEGDRPRLRGDRKSTRLNSSHTVISYAVFCLKKKKLGLRSLHTRWARD